MGDAVCSFNPVYGQGMSVAGVEALALRHHVEGGVAVQPRRFFRDLARVVMCHGTSRSAATWSSPASRDDGP